MTRWHMVLTLGVLSGIAAFGCIITLILTSDWALDAKLYAFMIVFAIISFMSFLFADVFKKQLRGEP